MSFNSNHITLENYEMYFLLYVDNELDAAGKAEVESFLLAYPHLQPELDGLLGTRLPAETFSFNKESLMAGQMKEQFVEEDLLLYIDDELPADRHKQVQLELALNPSYHQEYERLLRARLDASETIAYPNKKELYRTEERRRPFIYWVKIAAAVLIVASAGVLYWTSEELAPPPGEIASTFPAPSATPSAPIIIAPVKARATDGTNEALARNDDRVVNKTTGATVQKTNAVVKTVETGLGSVATGGEDEISGNISGNTETAYTDLPVRGALEPLAPQQQGTTINSAPVVTSSLAVRNTTITTVETPVVTDDEPEAKKASLKTFFRKATRMIAKTTGLEKASEGENEVLIGTMAVQLK